MNTHNIGFYEDLTKIIFELSSNMHLISSPALTLIRTGLLILCFYGICLQASMAALVTAIIGIPFPMHSIVSLPDSLIDTRNTEIHVHCTAM